MPRAEERTTPQGLPKGSVKQEQQFVQQTNPTSQTEDLAGSGAAPEAQASAPSATSSNVRSPLTTPAMPGDPEAGQQLPAAEPVMPNIDPATGLNLDDILFGPTQRPLEPGTAGLGPSPQGATPNVSATIQGLIQQSPSRDLQSLLEAAQNIGA